MNADWGEIRSLIATPIWVGAVRDGWLADQALLEWSTFSSSYLGDVGEFMRCMLCVMEIRDESLQREALSRALEGTTFGKSDWRDLLAGYNAGVGYHSQESVRKAVEHLDSH